MAVYAMLRITGKVVREVAGTRQYGPCGPVEEFGFYFVGNWESLRDFKQKQEMILHFKTITVAALFRIGYWGLRVGRRSRIKAGRPIIKSRDAYQNIPIVRSRSVDRVVDAKRLDSGYIVKMQLEGLNMGCETENSRMTPRFLT